MANWTATDPVTRSSPLQAYGNAELQVVATVLRDLLSAGKDGVRLSRH